MSKPNIVSITQINVDLFKVVYDNDTVYEGEFINGKKEGKGKMDYGEGEMYEGGFVNDVREGKGRYDWPDGSFQIGNWLNNEMHGPGIMLNTEKGDYYTGEFAYGNYTGNGTMVYGDESTYEGYWLYDKRHGQGKYTYKNGNFYEGEWQNDKKHGKGLFTWADEKEYYDGDWQKGKMSGYGIYHYESGNHYEGDMRNDQEHGLGYMKYSNGDEFRGEFSMGYAKKGIMCYENGDIYEGELSNDLLSGNDVPNGNGKMDYWAENSSYDGAWSNGKRHGQGTLYIVYDNYDEYGNKISTREYSGEWQNDMYYEPIRQLILQVNRQIVYENPGRVRIR
jgi:hypothetical protein